MPASTFLVIFKVCMNIMLIIKVKFFYKLINDHTGLPQLFQQLNRKWLTKVKHVVWYHHMSFWRLFLSLHPNRTSHKIAYVFITSESQIRHIYLYPLTPLSPPWPWPPRRGGDTHSKTLVLTQSLVGACKRITPWHVPNFEEYGFKFGPFLFLEGGGGGGETGLHRSFPTSIANGGLNRKPCQTVVLNRSWK